MEERNVEQDFLDMLEGRVYRVVKGKVSNNITKSGRKIISKKFVTEKMTEEDATDFMANLKDLKDNEVYYISNYKNIDDIFFSRKMVMGPVKYLSS